MRNLKVLILALTCILCLAGCSTGADTAGSRRSEDIGAASAGEEQQDQVSQDTGDGALYTALDANSDINSEIPGATIFIVEIIDRTKTENPGVDTAEEKFYEDENNEYYFNVIKSHYVMVTYNNGNSEDIVTALNAGRASISDLDEFGIEYRTKVKSE